MGSISIYIYGIIWDLYIWDGKFESNFVCCYSEYFFVAQEMLVD